MNYLKKIEKLVENHIVEVKRYEYHINRNLLETYFNIGKLLIEAQGGEARAKYGDGLIEEYSVVLTKKYGKGYDVSNLKRMRLFYYTFQKGATVWHQLSWSHYKTILSIKDINKRNYYINLAIDNRLSVRELVNEIKNNAFERLSYANKNNIELKSDNKNYSILEMIKDPIKIILENSTDKKLSEKALKKYILDSIEKFILELGVGFAFMGSEKKIKVGDTYKYIDLVFFNVKFIFCFNSAASSLIFLGKSFIAVHNLVIASFLASPERVLASLFSSSKSFFKVMALFWVSLIMLT